MRTLVDPEVRQVATSRDPRFLLACCAGTPGPVTTDGYVPV